MFWLVIFKITSDIIYLYTYINKYVAVVSFTVYQPRDIVDRDLINNKSDESNIESKAGSKIELGRYRHFKGKEYQVLGIAIHTETEEDMVIYKALYGDEKVFVRPLKMFNEYVELKDGRRVKRFEKINDVD
ncbi:DUF1653 domain-containing protein [Candidatus Micrarchaeota archaeon]|nr:DUF1653 domain-containing protein [Candidatus Micrarchaeota archaeon]